MKSRFFDIRYKEVYPEPTAEDFAIMFLNKIYRKLNVEDFTFLITWYGRHRSGKSLAAVSLSNIIDETFYPNMMERIVYTSLDLLKAFKIIRQNHIKGAAIIVDEAGTGDLSSQNWYEEIAKIVSANLQAIGYLNPLISFVTQDFGFINATARKLSNGVFKVQRHGRSHSSIKPFWINNSPFTKKYIHKYPVFCEKYNGGTLGNVYKINRIRIGLPPAEIRNAYIELSQEYKDKYLMKSEEDVMVSMQMKEQRNMFVTGIDAIANEVYMNIDAYEHGRSKDGFRIIDENLIRHQHKLSYRDAKVVKALVSKWQRDGQGSQGSEDDEEREPDDVVA